MPKVVTITIPAKHAEAICSALTRKLASSGGHVGKLEVEIDVDQVNALRGALTASLRADAPAKKSRKARGPAKKR